MLDKSLNKLIKLTHTLQFRFLLVGGINTFLGYLITLGIYELFGEKIHIMLLSVINSILCITISFTGHRRFVFKSTEHWLPEYLRMYVVNAFSILITMLGLWFLVDLMKIPFYLAQAGIMALLAVFMYFMHKYYTFKVSP